MEFRQLRYFEAIAQTGSFAAAAKVVNIAQPALSNQIASLEREIGRYLFVRHGRGVRLTPDGELFRKHAQAILADIDEMRRVFGLAPNVARKEFTIGMTPLISNVLAIPLVEIASQKLPKVSLRVIEGMSGALRAWLDSGRLDVSLSLNVPPSDPLYTAPIVFEDLYVISAKDSGLPDGGNVTEKEVIGLPQIASTASNGHRTLLEQIAARNGSHLMIAAEVDSIPRQREFVLRGKGVLILALTGLLGCNRSELNVSRLVGDDYLWGTSLIASPTFNGQEAQRQIRPLVLTLLEELIKSGQWLGARMMN